MDVDRRSFLIATAGVAALSKGASTGVSAQETTESITVPRVNEAPTIDGALEDDWTGATRQTLSFVNYSGGRTQSMEVTMGHDGSDLYVGLDNGFGKGWDNHTALHIDGDGDGSLQGRPELPHTDVKVGQPGPGAWSGYDTYKLLGSSESVQEPDGLAKASKSSGGSVKYEFRIPFEAIGAETGDSIGLFIKTHTPDHGENERFYWPGRPQDTGAQDWVTLTLADDGQNENESTETNDIGGLKLVQSIDGTDSHSRLGTAATVGDIDDDGKDEIIVGDLTYRESDSDDPDGGVFVYDGETGERIHTITDEETKSLGTSVATGDVDGDGAVEIIAGGVGANSGAQDGGVLVLNGQTGEVKTRIEGESGNRLGLGLSIGDVDDDGIPEIVATSLGTAENPTQRGVSIFDGATGERQVFIPDDESNSDLQDLRIVYPTEVADVNGDGSLEIIVGYPGGGKSSDSMYFPGKVVVYDATGEKIAERTGSEKELMGASLGTADLDGDGVSEIIAGAPSFNEAESRIVVFEDVLEGDMLTITRDDISAIAPPDSSKGMVGIHIEGRDLDGDGDGEIAFTTGFLGTGGLYLTVVDAGSGEIIGRAHEPVGFDDLSLLSSMATGDVAGDGIANIILGGLNGTAHSGDDGRVDVYQLEGAKPSLNIERSDVEIEFANNFRTESTTKFLESLYTEVQQAFPTANPSIPDENEAYIHVDMRIRFSDRLRGSIAKVRPVLTHDQTNETFTLSNHENFIGDAEYDGSYTVSKLEPGVFGFDNFRIRTPTQVGLQVIETLLAIGSALSVGEAASPLEAKTDAYPDVYVTALEIEDERGETAKVAVEKRIPRYDDVCTSVGLSAWVAEDCSSTTATDRYRGGAMVLSPATIAVRDDHGRITGRVWEDGEYTVLDEIPEATYSGHLRHEFVVFPDGAYDILVDGEQRGDATVKVDQVEDGAVRTETYADISVDESMRLKRPTDGAQLLVDTGRDGTADRELDPDTSTKRSPSELLESRIQSGNETEDSRDIPDWIPIVGGAGVLGAVGFGDYLYDHWATDDASE